MAAPAAPHPSIAVIFRIGPPLALRDYEPNGTQPMASATIARQSTAKIDANSSQVCRSTITIVPKMYRSVSGLDHTSLQTLSAVRCRCDQLRR